MQFGGYDNRALVVGGSSPFGNPPTVHPPARQDGDRHHRHRHRHHHHLTSSSDQLDRLENSLALEMVLVKRGEYGEKSWEENEVSCSECFIYLKGLRHTAFPSIDSFDLNLRGRNVESGSQALEFQKKQINKFFAIIIE